MVSKGFIKTVSIIFLIAVAVFIYYVVSNSEDLMTGESATGPSAGKSVEKLSKPTGNIDDLAKDIADEMKSEQQMVSGEDADATLLESDTKVIDEFGQSYNENEF
jgi:hypothetical protein